MRAPINRSIELPFDILDHIFSFLKSHPKALLACSEANSAFCQIVERYQFHHVIIRTGDTDSTYSFRPSDMHRHLAETPRIVDYVAVLQIEFGGIQDPKQVAPYLEEIASLLPMFPVLECIRLPTRPPTLLWQEDVPQSFRTAVENCLHLPTLQEVHVGNMNFPLSMLDNHMNINHLSLSRPPKIEPEYREATYPQIKSLALEGFDHRFSEVFCTWAKQHIVGLQTLKYDFSCDKMILEVFKICSNTLENLYLCLQRQGTPETIYLFNFSSLPHLRHLVIHTEIYFWLKGSDVIRNTYLRTTIEILKTAPSLQQLTIEIYVDPSLGLADASRIDLSALGTVLTQSACFHHIDLYIYTGLPQPRFTHTEMSSLFGYKEWQVMELIEQGVLVLHPEKTASALSRSYIARENNESCVIM